MHRWGGSWLSLLHWHESLRSNWWINSSLMLRLWSILRKRIKWKNMRCCPIDLINLEPHPCSCTGKNRNMRIVTSLVVHQIRICLPMQGTQIQSGKIPHAEEQLSLSTTTTEAHPPQWRVAVARPHCPHLEKACVQQQRPSTEKSK